MTDIVDLPGMAEQVLETVAAMASPAICGRCRFHRTHSVPGPRGERHILYGGMSGAFNGECQNEAGPWFGIVTGAQGSCPFFAERLAAAYALQIEHERRAELPLLMP
jgi:hypothetical protein